MYVNLFNNACVSGSPYKFTVDSIPSGYVTAYGSGLISGVSGEPSLFTISTKGAGAGGLSMAVEGPSKAEVGIINFRNCLTLSTNIVNCL
jgi:filamin